MQDFDLTIRKECPNCGSDDPLRVRLSGGYALQSSSYACPDPWHDLPAHPGRITYFVCDCGWSMERGAVSDCEICEKPIRGVAYVAAEHVDALTGAVEGFLRVLEGFRQATPASTGREKG